MAKLEGVKTLDMVNGEITKVEYGGAVYEKVDGKAQLGDLLLIVDAYKDTTEGSFYQALPYTDHIGYIEFKDDVGDIQTRDASSGYFVPFRKVPAPTIEQVDAKVDALAARVDALEDERHVYGKPHTVKRKARVGERILITDAIGKPYKNGDILTVTDIGGLGLPICGDYESFFHEEYEVIVEDKPHTFEVGDSVKVLAAGEFGGVDVGEIGTVTRVVTLKGDPYSIRVDGEDDHDYFRPQDLELVSEEKPKFKVGDYAKVVNYPNHYQNGTIVKIVNNEYSVIFPYDTQNLNGSEGDCHKEENLVKATDEEVAQAKRAAIFAKVGRKLDEFKKGDIVYNRGKISEVDEVSKKGNVYLKSGLFRFTDSLELIAPVESRVDSK